MILPLDLTAHCRDLHEAAEESRFGSKSVNLGEMLRAGLPVPGGWALSWELAQAVHAGERAAVQHLLDLGDRLAGAVAVRSSAIGEDSAEASFAGQHLTVLGVRGAHALVSAVLRVERSGNSTWAQSYRKTVDDGSEARVAVTVQHLLQPQAAGVLFTRNPVTGVDERLIEASWGLGESVVSSRVSPDVFRVSRDGEVLHELISDKRIELLPTAAGGVVEVAVSEDRRRVASLDHADLAELGALAAQCEVHFGSALDIEWAKADGRIWLLQARPITTSTSAAA